MENDRIRYGLNKYFRSRLEKLEDNLDYILSDASVLDRLSREEKVVITKIKTLRSNYLDDVLLSKVNLNLNQYIESSADLLKHSQPQFEVCRIKYLS